MSRKQQALFNTSSLSGAREMNRLKRERLIIEAGVKRVIPKPQAQSDEQAMEFNLPDEDRFHPVYLGHCPVCDYHNSARLETRRFPTMKRMYWIACNACEYKTPVLNTSAKAVRHWRVHQALIK